MRLIPDQLLRARFVDRLGRFLVRCHIDGGDLVLAQLPNPGRLTELLLPGAWLLLEDHRPAEPAPTPEPTLEEPPTQRSRPKAKRWTQFTVWAVEQEDRAVFLHTHRTNAVARHLLEQRRIPGLESARVVQAEVPHGRSRFDFLLEEGGQSFFLEVKSVTLFGNGAAQFPDAVTERGRHHLLQLAELGDEAARRKRPRPVVLFLVHSAGVDRFLPDFHTDLEFARTFLAVRDRVRLLPVSIAWTRSLQLGERVRPLPIPWDRLTCEVQDGGAYLLLLRLPEVRRFPVGQLGEIEFAPGWYVYVGSATRNLTARINRHLRKRKRFHWHIDFLRDQATEIIPLPIRSSRRQECAIAESLARILEPYAPGFGSSDCRCATHLYTSPDSPLHDRRFHAWLARFRMPAGEELTTNGSAL